jgi:hypothetical protein
MTDAGTPDQGEGLPDRLFPMISDDNEMEGDYVAVAAPEPYRAVSTAAGGALPNGDPPSWMLWGVEE